MEYNKVAAKWWADKLREIRPDNFNNGEETLAGGIAMILAEMLANGNRPSDEAVDKFENLLADTIKAQVEKKGEILLSVDYTPDFILNHVAMQAGIHGSVFPWKTMMWIRENHVTVSYGYASNTQIIFPEK